MSWKENILQDSAQIQKLILRTKRVAVLGIKTEKQASQPAFYVPEYLMPPGSK